MALVCVLGGFTPCRIRLTIANASLAEPAVYWKDDAVDLDGSRTCTSSTAEAAALLSNKTKAISKKILILLSYLKIPYIIDY